VIKIGEESFVDKLGSCVIRKAGEDGLDKDSITSDKFDKYHDECRGEM